MSSGSPTAIGQPPRQIRKAIFCSLNSFLSSNFSGTVNSLPKLTVPLDSPDPNRVIGRIVSHAKRPVPLCSLSCSAFLSGTAEPVSMNCPISRRWSTAYRTASQSLGTVCHSSMSIGVSPAKAASVSISSILFRCSFTSVLASIILPTVISSAVVVFPHHLGPSMSIAPLACSFFFSKPSIILCL